MVVDESLYGLGWIAIGYTEAEYGGLSVGFNKDLFPPHIFSKAIAHEGHTISNYPKVQAMHYFSLK